LRIRHTFLFEEGIWAVSGEYTGQNGAAVPVEGSARITHEAMVWRNRGVMTLIQPSGDIEIKNDYEIAPFEDGSDFTAWRAENPALGKLSGLFVVVDDSIISTISSEDGKVSGIEYLRKVSENHYMSRGFIFRGEEKLSSWAAELVRRTGALH
jgi:hypothetical protein